MGQVDPPIREIQSSLKIGAEGRRRQVNTLIYAMGDQANDIPTSFMLSDEDRKSYATVKSKFDNRFIQRRNVLFERAKFNRRSQEENEPAEASSRLSTR